MDISELAGAAFDAGDYETAARLFREAGARAERASNFGAAMVAFADAAIAGGKAGVPAVARMALARRARALAAAHPRAMPQLRTGHIDGFMAVVDGLYWDIVLQARPRRGELELLLRGLEASHGMCAELLTARAQFADATGEKAAALEKYERAWTLRRSETVSHAVTHAANIVEAALEVGDIAGARRWLEVARATRRREEQCRNCGRRLAEAELWYLLAINAEWGEMQRAYGEYRECRGGRRGFDELGVRVGLLDEERGDPGQAAHPSRRELGRREAGPRGMAERFRRALGLVDYRIACVRHAAGVRKVDDYYYRRAQVVKAELGRRYREQVARRAKRAEVAVKRAMWYAVKLDELLGCGWREKRIRARQARIREIVGHVDGEVA